MLAHWDAKNDCHFWQYAGRMLEEPVTLTQPAEPDPETTSRHLVSSYTLLVGPYINIRERIRVGLDAYKCNLESPIAGNVDSLHSAPSTAVAPHPAITVSG